MKKPVRFETNMPNSERLIEAMLTNPLMKLMAPIIEPAFKEMLPQLMDEYKALVMKANKRLDDMGDASEVDQQATMETYKVKLATYIQKRSLELMLPKIMQVGLLNPDIKLDLSGKQTQMLDQLSHNIVSDEYVRLMGSVAMSVATADGDDQKNAERIRFLNAQLKDPKSNCSILIRDSIKSLGDLNPQSLLDVKKWRESLIQIFSDELNEQCKLLSRGDNSNDSHASIDESDEKLLDITLLLTDENSSSYQVITHAAQLFNQRSHLLSPDSVKILMTKTHLELHQALEQEASEHFEAKSPRSARNRYFCQWSKEEDVTRLSPKFDDINRDNSHN